MGRWALSWVAALSVAVGAGHADAKCRSRGISAWPPPENSLPANARIVLEGDGDDQANVVNVAKQEPRLVADSDVVPLQLVELHEGAWRVTQAVPKLARPLQPGKRYVLRFKKGSEMETLRWDEPASPAWTAAVADVSPPRWKHPPEVSGSRFEKLGCGPLSETDVDVAAEDDRGPLQYQVDVRRADGRDPPRRFLLRDVRGKLLVGHGMCQGPFNLAPGVPYDVQITAMDAAGNRAEPSPQTLRVTGPR